MAPPNLIFNYDISCPFAYIASTRILSLAARTNTTLIYRPVLLGAIYRATAAPQGAGGSASDAFNPTKKVVALQSRQRTLRRFNVAYQPPQQHPRKTVDALRLLYCVDGAARDGGERRVLSEALFRAYWVDGRDVSDRNVLLQIARESGIPSAGKLSLASFDDAAVRKELESATAEAIERGAFGVPGFWIPGVRWENVKGEVESGRFFWGQDHMHFVEGTLLSLASSSSSTTTFPSAWTSTPHLRSLVPRAIPTNTIPTPTKLEFWFDFSSPWGYLGYTQLARLQRTFPSLTIELKPFLLGILYREIGAPDVPINAVSPAKRSWDKQDHADWRAWWNAVNEQEGARDARVHFYWPDQFPIRTPTLLRVGIVEPGAVRLMYEACWSLNLNVSSETVLQSVLDKAGYDGADLIAKANSRAVKAKLRELTAESKEKGICGVPTYRVLRQNRSGGWDLAGGVVWGQDEIGVVEDLIAGWDTENGMEVAKPRKVMYENATAGAKL